MESITIDSRMSRPGFNDLAVSTDAPTNSLNRLHGADGPSSPIVQYYQPSPLRRSSQQEHVLIVNENGLSKNIQSNIPTSPVPRPKRIIDIDTLENEINNLSPMERMSPVAFEDYSEDSYHKLVEMMNIAPLDVFESHVAVNVSPVSTYAPTNSSPTSDADTNFDFFPASPLHVSGLPISGHSVIAPNMF